VQQTRKVQRRRNILPRAEIQKKKEKKKRKKEKRERSKK
jgi:hypothetical protein